MKRQSVRGLGVSLRNLADQALRLSREEEKRIGLIREAAHEAAALACTSPAGGFSALYRHASSVTADWERFSLHEDVLEAHRRPLTLQARRREYMDKIAFSAAFLEEAEARLGRAAELSDFQGIRKIAVRDSRVSYIENPHAKEAYHAFSPYFGRATVKMRHTFREVADDVKNGYADYGILPLLSDEEPVRPTDRLLWGAGLRVVAAFRETDTPDETVYALLAKETLLLDDPRFFYLGLPADPDDGAMGGLTDGILSLGGHLLRGGRVPRSYEEGEALSLTVTGDGRFLLLLLSFLTLFAPDYTALGLYFEVKKQTERE